MGFVWVERYSATFTSSIMLGSPRLGTWSLGTGRLLAGRAFSVGRTRLKADLPWSLALLWAEILLGWRSAGLPVG